MTDICMPWRRSSTHWTPWFRKNSGNVWAHEISQIWHLEVDMKVAIVALVILLILAFVLGSAYVSRRNQMAIKREAVNAAWAQVDVVLQRRADLIPNLVETVKGFATHEGEVFGEIAKARAGYMNATTPADKIAANSQLETSLAKVLVLTENYPQLKSNENFLRLQDELAGTENRIAVERRRYNETV